MGARVQPLLAAVTGVFALASCVAAPANSPRLPGASGQFVRHPEAIEALPSPVPGPGRTPRSLALVPLGECALGIDNDVAGPSDAGGNWLGAPGCMRLELSPRPEPTGDRLPSGALRVYSAVPTRDGAVVGIGHYALPPARNGTILAAPSLWRREPDGSVRELARVPMQWSGNDWLTGTQATGLVRMDQQLFLAGSDVVDGRITPVVWTSEDGGATLTQQRLPPAPTDRPLTDWDQSQTRVPARIATDGQTLLATALSPDQGQRLWTWRSADGGRTWQVIAASRPPGLTWLTDHQVIDVTKVEGRWLVFGGNASSSFVLSSSDGTQWTVEDSLGRASVVIGVTVDHRGELVVLGEYPGAARRGTGKSVSVDECGVVWSGQLAALRRQELGCAGVSSFSSVATIADGRVLIANGTDLWIRD